MRKLMRSSKEWSLFAPCGKATATKVLLVKADDYFASESTTGQRILESFPRDLTRKDPKPRTSWARLRPDNKTPTGAPSEPGLGRARREV
jgi:hypothetical protein